MKMEIAKMTKMVGEDISILLVEDNPDDITITKRAFEKGKIKNELNVVKSGEEALNFLCQKGEYKGASIPGLILLDLNLPGVSGYEVLEKIKENEKLRRIPVIILTVSNHEKDIMKTYDLGANNYITKPVEFRDFIEVAIAITDYWLRISRIPSG